MARSQLATHASVEVLAPQLDLTAQLTKVTEIEELFRSSFISTEHASKCFRWLDELRLLKQCGRVVGPRDVGKSRTLIEYREEDRKRVSYVKAWTGSSYKRCLNLIA